MSETGTTPAERPFVGPAWLDRAARWVKANEYLVLLIAAGFHIAVLAGMIAIRARPLLTGETILVRVVPVDPRDLFRGDYVILSYDFTQFPVLGTGDRPLEDLRDHEVFVTLVPEPDGRHWRAGQATLTRPPTGRYIRGRIAERGRLEFGIESYFVQEGRGREYEDAIRNRRLSAEIAVTADGQAALRGLRVE